MKNAKLILSLIAVFLITANVHAQVIRTANIEENFDVKFTGVQDNYLCFQVEIKNAGSNIILKISDKSEGELYTQNWKIRTPYQFFKIEKKDG